MKCPHCRADNPDTSRFCAACGTGLGASPEPGGLQTRTLQSPAQSPLVGTLFAGKYEILSELGRGGMGEVYLAKDIGLARTVALKLLPEERYQDAEYRERLVREAKAAAALDHPYVCSVHEVGEAEGRLFFVMEYVEGRTLRDRIAQGPVPIKQALDIAVEAGEALQCAHEKGLIHRDIKPANIMLMASGHAKVMDFGLAKAAAGARPAAGPDEAAVSLTKDGLSPGTPAYMSPEQLRGEELDARSDIFSLGMVLYEMLTGVHPFKGETGFTTASAILRESSPPLNALTRGMPESVQQVVDRMLAKDPQDRYPSVASALEDIKNIRSGLPVEAKIRRFLKPARLAAAAGVLVVAVLGAAWLAKMIFFKSAATALAFQPRDWILITDFENLTGDQVFDGSLETALTVGIQQSQHVNVFPRTRVQETLRRMRREDAKKVDESLGREVALREGIKGVLACQVSKIGENYLLTSRVVDPETQVAVFSYAVKAEGKDAVLDALDRLARKVRRELGESLSRISERKLSLARATTSSLAALKLLTDARSADQTTSIKLLEQAIALDTDFALAHAETGMRYSWAGDRVKAEEHFQKALGLLDRLTTREQLWIRALVEDWRGNREQGIENYKSYLEQYPDDSSAWHRLAYAYMITDHTDLSIAAFKKALSIDPSSSSAYVNIATCYNLQEKFDLSLENYAQAFKLNPGLVTGLFINHEYGFVLVRTGRVEEAVQTFDTMTQQDELPKKAKGYRSSAYLNMYRGKYSDAEKDLRNAILTNKAGQLGLSEMRDHLILATVYAKKNNRRAFENEMAAVERLRKELKLEPYFLYLIGKVEARSGRLPEAARRLEELKSRLGDLLAVSGVNRSSQGDQSVFYMLQGEVAAASRRYDEAIESFESGARLGARFAEGGIAHAYERKGDLDGAIKKYEEFLRRMTLGDEAQESWILAHYELGKLYEQKGQVEQAARYYERFLDIWKDADADLPEVADARKRLARLKGSRG